MAVTSPQRSGIHCSIVLEGQSLSDCYAASLLHSLGISTNSHTATRASTSSFEFDTARDWAESGLMWLTGDPSGPPVLGRGSIPSCARGALDALRTLVALDLPETLDGATLLGERSQLLGISRQGRVSANGSCHLLSASDGTIALNLAREEDWRLLPAWLESDEMYSQWDSLAEVIAGRKVELLLARGRLLGLPVASCSSAQVFPVTVPPWFRLCGDSRTTSTRALDKQPLVVDLSALWAGPLCSHLLLAAGARVIKVESAQRPDGARMASPEFFDLLNADKDSVAVNLHAESGRRQLRALISMADIVIEGSRPRALAQFGIDAQEVVDQHPGMIWISITGYGRLEPQANWVAYGDDAAVAAGVFAGEAEPVFCGDAICDPLVGLHAALAAMAFWRCGHGGLLDINLCDVAAHCNGFYTTKMRGTVLREERCEHWLLAKEGREFDVQQPRRRLPVRRAATLGANTREVFREFDIAC